MKKIKNLKRVNIDLLSHQRVNFEQKNTSIALNLLFVSYNSEEIKLAYKSRYNNKRKNQVIFLMSNDEANNCYYFAVKNLSELYSLGWLRSKKEAIINGDNNFQNALEDALNYQNIERDPQRISKLERYFNKYNWKGIEFSAGPKDSKKFERNNKTITLNILFIPHNTETIRVAYRSVSNFVNDY